MSGSVINQGLMLFIAVSLRGGCDLLETLGFLLGIPFEPIEFHLILITLGLDASVESAVMP
jgi:hypothetical protein